MKTLLAPIEFAVSPNAADVNRRILEVQPTPDAEYFPMPPE
ncbi:MAG TPA: hypothetical protein VEZ90_18645 [Blastocatellia bacterium]|nr:hypothetical protein [Blastocatellia bacterium]